MFFLKEYKWLNENFTWTFEALGGSSILLTIPHDRAVHPSDLMGIFEPRKKGIKGHDSFVWPIVKDMLLKTNVNVVRGLLPRNFVDYNRSIEGVSYDRFSESETETAIDNEQLAFFYKSYHQAIVNFLIKVIKKNGRKKCLLVDLHGFTKQPVYGEYDLILGTGNRKTISANIDQLFAKFMSKLGYNIFLPSEETVVPGVDDRYAAEFTARHYAEKFGIDTMQIEIAKKFRILEGTEIGQKLSYDMANFFSQQFNS